ncbi:VOC family protein [Nitrococcus mobilis]|uniref:Glyoxalase/bleomycin resistance protein/dioxygenase n=1 Tax=Nitrococcus mobilis Nb-231 TaxID=314278 RepID=A4BUP7_9GAMM|nr:VOC family protein [Nitrococcus mobilis]EAR20613.1 Glyoxalase/bleomycin resistance protein/dioxygenase [Nitrococcus mobilis Nb-231]
MAIEGMNHFTVISSDLGKTKAFYLGVLGLLEGYRPPMESTGAWLYAADQKYPILHIIAERPMPENASGVIDHMAFTATGLQSTIDTLKQHGIAYKLNRIKELGVWQLFCHDPDGARVELDFPADEPEPQE